ncbi:hypothetical protein V2J09_016101 [Rumex salicifolius]
METEPATLTVEKPVMLVAIDESEHSFYALEWTLDHFFVPHAPNFPFDLIVIHAKPSPAASIGYAGPGGVEILPVIDSDLRKIAQRVADRAKELSISKSVSNMVVEVWEGDPRNVMCEAVEKHQATILVVGNHGYGTIKRALLGSVSDYCAHHAHCSVMIVKRPKPKH